MSKRARPQTSRGKPAGSGAAPPAPATPPIQSAPVIGWIRQPRWLLMVLFVSIIPALEVYRFAVFAATEGGIEHDSGWYFGVARNLAQRGIYASSTNIAITADPLADGIHYWPTLQDEQGFTYFSPGVTVGPSFIVPEAIVVKLLGAGYWQYRLLPLTVMLCFLVLLSLLAYVRAGPLAVALLQLWLWVLPQVTFNFAYEAFSEDLALFYSLLAFCAYGYAVNHLSLKKSQWLGVGLLLALAYLTKTLYMSSAAAIGLHLAWRIAHRQFDRRQVRWIVCLVLLGFLLPVMAFEVYRFAAIVGKFGLEGYYSNNLAYALVFRMAGSGLSSSFVGDHGLLRAKFAMLGNIGLLVAPLAWGLGMAASGFALRPSAARSSSPHDRVIRTILIVITIKVVLVLAWFVAMTQSRFTRHAWDALVLLMLLVSIGTADALKCVWRRRGKELAMALLIVLLASLNVARFDFRSTEPWPWLRFDRVMRWYQSYRRPLQFVVFAAVFQRQAQEDVVDFFRREVREEDRIYYLTPNKVTELPALVDHVFFPFERYASDGPTLPGKAFLVLGSYQIGDWPWRIEDKVKTGKLLSFYQKHVVLENEYYVVIEIPKHQRVLPDALWRSL